MKDSQWIPELRRRCQADVQMRVYQQKITHLRNHLLSTMTPWQQKILQDYESRLTDFARLLAKESYEIGLEQHHDDIQKGPA